MRRRQRVADAKGERRKTEESVLRSHLVLQKKGPPGKTRRDAKVSAVCSESPGHSRTRALCYCVVVVLFGGLFFLVCFSFRFRSPRDANTSCRESVAATSVDRFSRAIRQLKSETDFVRPVRREFFPFWSSILKALHPQTNLDHVKTMRM